jgi:chromosome segregation ATPase
VEEGFVVDWRVWAALGAVAVSLSVCVVVVVRQLKRNSEEWERQRGLERSEREEARRRSEQLHGANLALQEQIKALIAQIAEMATANAGLKTQVAEEVESMARLRKSVHDQRNEASLRDTTREVENHELRMKLTETDSKLSETSKKLNEAMAQIAAFTCKAETLVQKKSDAEVPKPE